MAAAAEAQIERHLRDVCGAVDDGNCSIRQQKITVGQTISGMRARTATQVLKFLGYSCVFGGTPAKDRFRTAQA